MRTHRANHPDSSASDTVTRIDPPLSPDTAVSQVRTMAHFRLIQAPCCGTSLCWVNPRLPNYCPECGTFIWASLKHHYPENIVISVPEAWISYAEQS